VVRKTEHFDSYITPSTCTYKSYSCRFQFELFIRARSKLAVDNSSTGAGKCSDSFAIHAEVDPRKLDRLNVERIVCSDVYELELFVRTSSKLAVDYPTTRANGFSDSTAIQAEVDSRKLHRLDGVVATVDAIEFELLVRTSSKLAVDYSSTRANGFSDSVAIHAEVDSGKLHRFECVRSTGDRHAASNRQRAE